MCGFFKWRFFKEREREVERDREKEREGEEYDFEEKKWQTCWHGPDSNPVPFEMRGEHYTSEPPFPLSEPYSNLHPLLEMKKENTNC